MHMYIVVETNLNTMLLQYLMKLKSYSRWPPTFSARKSAICKIPIVLI